MKVVCWKYGKENFYKECVTLRRKSQNSKRKEIVLENLSGSSATNGIIENFNAKTKQPAQVNLVSTSLAVSNHLVVEQHVTGSFWHFPCIF